jgi:hypothetical protein
MRALTPARRIRSTGTRADGGSSDKVPPTAPKKQSPTATDDARDVEALNRALTVGAGWLPSIGLRR